ncbi:hypothetical protein BU14_2854s0001, partial [Porphyra umbilicalis]
APADAADAASADVDAAVAAAAAAAPPPPPPPPGAPADAGDPSGPSVGLGAEFISRPPGRELEGSPLVSVASSIADAALLGPRPSTAAGRVEREVGQLLSASRIRTAVAVALTAVKDPTVEVTPRTVLLTLGAANRLSWASAATELYAAATAGGVRLGLREYNNTLRTLSRVGAVDRMRAIIEEMWAAGGGSAPDTHSYDQLVTALAVSRAHTVKDALDVTDEMRARGVMPSVGTYERFMAACVAANKVRMATATLSAMDDQGVAANARTYAVVLGAAAAANLTNDLHRLLPAAVAALGPYTAYLRKGPATTARYRRVGASAGTAAAPPTTTAGGGDAPPLTPRIEVAVLLMMLGAAARTNHAPLAEAVWRLARSPTYADWTPPVSALISLLGARAGVRDVAAAFDAVDEMEALGYAPNAVRCRRLIVMLSSSPATLDDAW